MNTALPGSKLVAIVREPFARAVSHYKFSVQHGAEPLEIEEALTPEAEARDYDVRKFSVSPYLYLTRGRYADLLQPWLDVYGRSRLHVVVLERLIKDPSTLVELHRFLEIPERDAPKLFVANSSSGPAPQLAPERVRRIRESFVEPNSRLAAMFDLDLDLWRPEVPTGTGETAAQEPREDRSE